MDLDDRCITEVSQMLKHEQNTKSHQILKAWLNRERKCAVTCLSNSTRKLLWFEISKMLIAVLKIHFLCYLFIIFGTSSFAVVWFEQFPELERTSHGADVVGSSSCLGLFVLYIRHKGRWVTTADAAKLLLLFVFCFSCSVACTFTARIVAVSSLKTSAAFV